MQKEKERSDVPEEKSSECRARSSHVAWPPGSRAGSTSCWCRWGQVRPSCFMPEGQASCELGGAWVVGRGNEGESRCQGNIV